MARYVACAVALTARTPWRTGTENMALRGSMRMDTWAVGVGVGGGNLDMGMGTAEQ